MPTRAAHPCGQSGCKTLVRNGSRCDAHRREREAQRGSSTERGYDGAWRKLRSRFISQHPHCVACLAEGKTVQGQHVDHIKAHRGDDALRLEWDNLQTLCASCHSRKTVARDGGFGRY